MLSHRGCATPEPYLVVDVSSNTLYCGRVIKALEQELITMPSSPQIARSAVVVGAARLGEGSLLAEGFTAWALRLDDFPIPAPHGSDR
jgi:hypothetical protein